MITKLWARPEIYRIFIPMPDNPLRNLNCYVLREGGECLILDTGFNRPECAQALKDGLTELGVRPERARLCLTHLHSDHSGLAGGFAARDIPIYMSGIDHDYLRRILEGSIWPVVEARFLQEGFPEEAVALQSDGNQARLFAAKSLFPVIRLAGGETLSLGPWRFSCILTPGHTPGHICLYCEDLRILFSGDHILFDVTPTITVWNGVPHSLADYLASLEKVKNLPVARTFPAHRERLGDTQARIEAIIEHHYGRLGEILLAVGNSPGISAYDIAGRITWSARGRPWSEFSPHQRWFAMGETLSHLVWLLDGAYVFADSGRKYFPSGKALSREGAAPVG
ncbi:MAG: MBL fold metallo-hydrolase [Desulfovibrio sp.]|jgi:glyoxylase-like metal-dependent hydrolase (beta-lactamase superfamily II)|nr:MBL fold metallo-hydrolase [Desulfovibrio sp.]